LSRLRALDAELQAEAVAAIDERLEAVSRQHGAMVLLAVESGSRAWGFPSPDSDYDCRFIYVREQADYLSLSPPRDVIEFPTDPVLDVNGWDLAKALRLLLKGNAVVIEWLTSPIVYAGSADFRDEAMTLAESVADAGAIARHYLHLGARQRRIYFNDSRNIALKKIFYALRPAIALRWLRLHPGRAVAPMHFPTLVGECDLDAGIVSIVEDLLARKAVTRELGRGPLPPPIGALIDSEFAIAAGMWGAERTHRDDTKRQAADVLFRRWVLADRHERQV
jgi:uncharacterized protein